MQSFSVPPFRNLAAQPPRGPAAGPWSGGPVRGGRVQECNEADARPAGQAFASTG